MRRLLLFTLLTSACSSTPRVNDPVPVAGEQPASSPADAGVIEISAREPAFERVEEAAGAPAARSWSNCPNGTEETNNASATGSREEYCSSLGSNQKHGFFTRWYSGGKLAEEGSYDHGRKHGKWRSWHPSGKLAGEGAYDRDIQQGEWTTWDENGYVASEGSYTRGVKQGRWREGSSEGSYRNGRKHGRWIEHEMVAGEPTSAVGDYVDGKRHGKWSLEYPRWRVEVEYRHGKEIHSVEYVKDEEPPLEL